MAMALDDRLGLNVHRDQWATPALLKSYEAAGFAWVQVHTPPKEMLAQREPALRHARALRAGLATTGLRLVLHGPDDLSAGTEAGDRALDGLLDYAREAGAELVAYHGLNVTVGDEAPARAAAEEVALRRAAGRAEALGVTLAVENLAPVWPGTDRLCHDALAVRDLVRRVDSPAVGMLLDLGHAHLMSSIERHDLATVVRACRSEVVLLHVHDNLGARRNDLDQPGIDPVKLDLHLAPGAGCLPWDAVVGLLRDHDAPLMLEVERSYVSDPSRVRATTLDLLRRGGVAATAKA
ncbi:sugar phosphate isomerase/epimerase [Conexibacter sp. SYSU D00693]|uniref:sugar phosphate isomerase/epimerase family protein n=1 Tax=Conexibacter sp. SYSU D00693 TaxID=2812560 RepID=UPI00196A2C64|nr:sugar phosphate isomerase/epimerase [Conexibacter sp. SYSU D00693]